MKIRSLNTLRGLAALIVVVSHFSNRITDSSGLLGSGAGQYGVILFFIISGFLMSYLYLDTPYTKSTVQRFIAARVARVLPLFFLVVITSYVLSISDVPNYFFPVKTPQLLISHLLFLFGVSVLWTIPIEIHFYLIFILLWKLYARSKDAFFITVAMLIAGIYLLGFPKFTGEIFGLPYHIEILFSLPVFLAGVLLGRLHKNWEAPQSLQSNWFALILLFIPVMYPNIFRTITGRPIKMWNNLGTVFVLSIIVFVCLFLVPKTNKILSNRFGDFIGEISYSMYLLHIPTLLYPFLKILNQSSDRMQTGILIFPIYLALIALISAISYRLIEAPARNYLRHLLFPKTDPATSLTN